MSITLEHIKAEQAKITAMIAALEAKAARTIVFPEFKIELNEGEHYAGIVIGKDGAKSHHLILLPGEADSVDWEDAKSFASNAGGELPMRREQSLLFANLKDQFQGLYYWSSEQHAGYVGYAWCHDFLYGSQNFCDKGDCFLARAVRRVPIKF